MSKSEALDAAAERHYPGIMRRMATVVENRPIGTTQKGEFAMGTYTSRENPVLRAVRGQQTASSTRSPSSKCTHLLPKENNMPNTHRYIDGKCSPECGGGHPIAPDNLWQRVKRAVRNREIRVRKLTTNEASFKAQALRDAAERGAYEIRTSDGYRDVVVGKAWLIAEAALIEMASRSNNQK